MKKSILNLLVTFTLIVGITFLAGVVAIENYALNLIVNVGFYWLMGIIALIAMKLSDIKVEWNLNKGIQYVLGVILALFLSLLVAVIPALCGTSLIGNHVESPAYRIIVSNVESQGIHTRILASTTQWKS